MESNGGSPMHLEGQRSLSQVKSFSISSQAISLQKRVEGEEEEEEEEEET